MKPERYTPIALAVLLGCGETRQEVIDRYRPRMDEMRQKIAALHGKLPVELTTAFGRVLDPKPEFDQEAQTGNTDFLSEEQLLDIYADPPVELHLARSLEYCLAWTGPSNPSAPEALRERDASFAANFETALATHYLVVLRSRAEEISSNDTGFTGGSAAIDAFVVDLATEEVVAGLRVGATPDDRVEYSFRPGENENLSFESAVRSSARSKLRPKLADALAKATGGSFTFR